MVNRYQERGDFKPVQKKCFPNFWLELFIEEEAERGDASILGKKILAREIINIKQLVPGVAAWSSRGDSGT